MVRRSSIASFGGSSTGGSFCSNYSWLVVLACAECIWSAIQADLWWLHWHAPAVVDMRGYMRLSVNFGRTAWLYIASYICSQAWYGCTCQVALNLDVSVVREMCLCADPDLAPDRSDGQLNPVSRRVYSVTRSQ